MASDGLGMIGGRSQGKVLLRQDVCQAMLGSPSEGLQQMAS